MFSGSLVTTNNTIRVAPGFQHIEQIAADLIPEKPIVCSLDPRVGRLGLRFYTPFSKVSNICLYSLAHGYLVSVYTSLITWRKTKKCITCGE